MKWIRWKGLIAFFAIVIIIGGLWFLFVDTIVERMIETTGTRLNGAEVDIDSADLTLFPAGLRLTGIQVTNPDEPTKNALEVKEVKLGIDGLNLLRRKVIVEDMKVDGVRFNTPRKRAGRVVSRGAALKSAVKRTVCEDFELKLPSLDIPDVKEILKQERLESLELIEGLQMSIKEEKERWKKELDNLPNKEKFEEYRRRIEKLKGGKGGIAGIFGAAGDIKKIQDDINRDIQSIKEAEKGFKERLSLFRKKIDEAKRSPLKDIERLKDRYMISPGGINDLAQRLLSARLCGLVEKAIEWYDRLRPAIERARKAGGNGETRGPEVVKPLRARGFDVRFRDYAPVPDFLIRVADVSVELPFGILGGKIENITPDQDILGLPLSFSFTGEGLKGLDSARISGEIDHTDPSNTRDAINLSIKGYGIKDLILSEGKPLPLVLRSGVGDISLKAVLKGERIDASIRAGFKSVRLVAGSAGKGSPVLVAVRSALSGLKGLNIRADVSGRLDDYRIKVSSDLDRVLGDAISGTLKEQASRFEKELKNAVFAKVNPSLSGLDSGLKALGPIDGELKNRLNLGSSVLGGGVKKGLPGGIKLPF